MKKEWKCVLGGEPYEIIKKQNAETTWIKAKPLTIGQAEGPHIVLISGTVTSIHYDYYLNQHELSNKRYPQNYCVQSLGVNQNPQFLNCSGASSSFIVPAEPEITQISTSVISGMACITSNSTIFVHASRSFWTHTSLRT
ncbi:MAG TPA: hypothetical protein VJZ32_10190 [Candidatus Bathyarchaeia archaeon]|nr:hypothetical protein [Candidatus Bathyarchaeia archaeon]